MINRIGIFVFLAAAYLICSCASHTKSKSVAAGQKTNKAAADSAQKAVDSATIADTSSPSGEKQTLDTSSSNTSLSAASKLMIKACENYVAVNPESPKVPEVLSIQGAVYYNNELYPESRQVYSKIIDEHKKSPYILEAVRMVAQSHYQEKNFDESQKWYRKMSEIADSGVDREEAIARIAQSVFKMAEMYESQQRFDEAAAQYERVALEFPKSNIAQISLLNAGNAYEKLAEWSRAILIYQRLGKKYPSSEHLPKSMFRTAKCYEKLLEWERAAQTYLLLVKNHPTSDLTEASLYNAGFCYENSKKLIEAAAIFEKLAYSFPKSEDAADVLFRAGELYGRLKDWPNVTRVNQEFSRRYGNDINRVVQALCMVGVALYMQNKHEEAVNQLEKATATYRKLKQPSDVNRFYAAKAQFTIGEIYHEQQSAIALKLPRSAYKKQLRIKTDLLDKSIEAYSKVIPYEISEWTTRSIYQLGQSYEDFALGVFKQQRPANLTIEQHLALELGIANAVEEYYVERALNYHEQNVKLGIKEKLEDKHVLNSKRKLTYLPYVAGGNFLALVDIAQKATSSKDAEGFALIAQKLQTLQKIAPFQERAIRLFLKTLEMGSMYEEQNEFYTKASNLITKTSFTVAETYTTVSNIAREAPIPQDFDDYEQFVYKKKLLDQIQDYEDNALTSYLKALKIASAYTIKDDYVTKTKEHLAKLLFIRGRCYDLLGINAYAKPPYPAGISEEEKEEYLARFQEIALNFQEQAFDIYRGILDYAKKDYAGGEYINHAYVRLYQNYPKEFGYKQAGTEKKSISSGPKWKCIPDSQAGWNSLDFNDSKWLKVSKAPMPDSIAIAGFPQKAPMPMWAKLKSAEASEAETPQRLYFRRSFYITEPPKQAQLYVAAASEYAVFLNGNQLALTIDSTFNWKNATAWNLAGKLRRGKNVLAAYAANAQSDVYGFMPYLSIVATVYSYLPIFPKTDVPVEKQIVADGTWVFPKIKNFSLDSTSPTQATN